MKRVLSLFIALLLFVTAVPVVEAQALDLNEKGTLYYVEFNAGSGNGRAFFAFYLSFFCIFLTATERLKFIAK